MHIVKTNPRFAMPDSSARREAHNEAFNQQDQDTPHPQRAAPNKISAYGHTMADVEKQILDWQEEMKQDSESLKVLSHSPNSPRE